MARTGKVRNASNHGIFVETDFQDVGVHQPLEVEFDLRAAVPAPDQCRFRAVVARMGERGLGLELDGGSEACDHAFRVLVDRLRSGNSSALNFATA